jgi:AbrB family looped-hinge helix DNA binding protein
MNNNSPWTGQDSVIPNIAAALGYDCYWKLIWRNKLMNSITVTVSAEGYVPIPEDVRKRLHWETGTELTLLPTGEGLVLKIKKPKDPHRLEDLIGMLKHEGTPISIKALCQPVDYRADWAESCPSDKSA